MIKILGLAIIYKAIVIFLKDTQISKLGSYTWVNKTKQNPIFKMSESTSDMYRLNLK